VKRLAIGKVLPNWQFLRPERSMRRRKSTVGFYFKHKYLSEPTDATLYLKREGTLDYKSLTAETAPRIDCVIRANEVLSLDDVTRWL
jgi:hypothetical protein